MKDMGFNLKLLRFFKRRLLPQKTHFWEYQGRMNFVSEFLKCEATSAAKVLDVGGVPGDNLLKKFGISHVTTLDLNPKADIVASAAKIPLNNGAFDFVTCIDTLEHVPEDLRTKVLEELVRVAKIGVAIVAPQDTQENRSAEALVLEYVDNVFLKEHRSTGLWNASQAEAQLEEMQAQQRIARYERHEMDDLLVWTCLMTEDHVNSSEIHARTRFLENRFHPRRVGFLIWK